MGPAAAAPATSVMNSRRLMCSPWSEGSHAITSLRRMPRCRGGDALSHRRFIDYLARPPPDARALRPDALPRDIHPACVIPRSEVPPSDTPPSIELLTVGLVTLQEFASLQVGKPCGLLRRDFVEPDRHEDAE